MSPFHQKVIMLCVLILLSVHNVVGTHEKIINCLEGNLDLIVHCKSKDDDIGVHLLHHGESFGWSFHPRVFFGQTLFFCGFTWNGKLHWFDVYDGNNLKDDCDECNWKIFKSGPCKTEGDGQSTCFLWNKQQII